MHLPVSIPHVAGLPTPGEPYSAWEAAEGGGYPDPNTPTRTLRGHFVGHLLSGLALGYAASGNASLAARAKLLVRELRRCQLALGSGFVSAWPTKVLDTLEAGEFGAVWAPWYLDGLAMDWHRLPSMATHVFSDYLPDCSLIAPHPDCFPIAAPPTFTPPSQVHTSQDPRWPAGRA